MDDLVVVIDLVLVIDLVGQETMEWRYDTTDGHFNERDKKCVAALLLVSVYPRTILHWNI